MIFSLTGLRNVSCKGQDVYLSRSRPLTEQGGLESFGLSCGNLLMCVPTSGYALPKYFPTTAAQALAKSCSDAVKVLAK